MLLFTYGSPPAYTTTSTSVSTTDTATAVTAFALDSFILNALFNLVYALSKFLVVLDVFHNVVKHGNGNVGGLQRKFRHLFNIVGQVYRGSIRQRVRIRSCEINAGLVKPGTARNQRIDQDRPTARGYVLQHLQIVHFYTRHCNVRYFTRKVPKNGVLGRTYRPHFVRGANEPHNFAQVEVAHNRSVLLAVRHTFFDSIVTAPRKHVVRQFHEPVLVYNGNRLFTVVAHDAVRFAPRKPFAKIVQSATDLGFLRKCGGRQHNIWNNIFCPRVVYNGVVRVGRVIQHNRGFVPVHYEAVQWVERVHVVHRVQIRFHVAYHKLHVVAHTVVHFTNAARAPIAGGFLRRKVVQSDVVNVIATERKCDLLLHSDGRLCQSNAHVPRGANENNAKVFGYAERGERFSGTGGRNVEHQLRFGAFNEGEQLLLMVVQLQIGVLVNEFVAFHVSVRVF